MGTFFDKIDMFIVKKSSKHVQERREFAEIYQKSTPKPAQYGGMRLIPHKFRAMAILLEKYGIFISHLETLAHADS